MKVVINGYVVPVYKSGRKKPAATLKFMYEGWNFNSGNYLFTTDTK